MEVVQVVVVARVHGSGGVASGVASGASVPVLVLAEGHVVQASSGEDTIREILLGLDENLVEVALRVLAGESDGVRVTVVAAAVSQPAPADNNVVRTIVQISLRAEERPEPVLQRIVNGVLHNHRAAVPSETVGDLRVESVNRIQTEVVVHEQLEVVSGGNGGSCAQLDNLHLLAAPLQNVHNVHVSVHSAFVGKTVARGNSLTNKAQLSDVSKVASGEEDVVCVRIHAGPLGFDGKNGDSSVHDRNGLARSVAGADKDLNQGHGEAIVADRLDGVGLQGSGDILNFQPVSTVDGSKNASRHSQDVDSGIGGCGGSDKSFGSRNVVAAVLGTLGRDSDGRSVSSQHATVATARGMSFEREPIHVAVTLKSASLAFPANGDVARVIRGTILVPVKRGQPINRSLDVRSTRSVLQASCGNLLRFVAGRHHQLEEAVTSVADNGLVAESGELGNLRNGSAPAALRHGHGLVNQVDVGNLVRHTGVGVEVGKAAQASGHHFGQGDDQAGRTD